MTFYGCVETLLARNALSMFLPWLPHLETVGLCRLSLLSTLRRISCRAAFGWRASKYLPPFEAIFIQTQRWFRYKYGDFVLHALILCIAVSLRSIKHPCYLLAASFIWSFHHTVIRFCYFASLQLMLSRVAAVKGLPVHHYSDYYISSPL